MSASLLSPARLAQALFSSALLIAALTGLSGQAQAATATTLPCSAENMGGDVSGFSFGCEVLDARNDSAGELNAEAAFGIDDWVFAAKAEFTNGGVSYETGGGAGGKGKGKKGGEASDEGAEAPAIGFSLTEGASTTSGGWQVSDEMWGDWASAMVLFKSATNVVMFFLAPNVSSGLYGLSTRHDISHVSVYVSETSLFADGSRVSTPDASPVPLPPAALLLGAGLGGLGLVGARKGRRKG